MYRLIVNVYGTSPDVLVNAIFEQEQNGKTERLETTGILRVSLALDSNSSHEEILNYLHQSVPILIAQMAARRDAHLWD